VPLELLGYQEKVLLAVEVLQPIAPLMVPVEAAVVPEQLVLMVEPH
jgi:hypothetical protein